MVNELQFTIEENPAAKGPKLSVKTIKKFNKASEYYLTPEQIDKLLASTTNLRNRVILSLMSKCGLRRAEVRNLRVEWIDFNNNWLNVIGKGSKRRTIPLPKSLLNDLRVVVKNKKEGLIFLNRFENKLSLNGINEICKVAGIKVGLQNPNPTLKFINPHLLRHSFAREFLKRGGRSEVLRMILGHESISTTLNIYGEPTVEEIKREYEKTMGN